MRIIIPALMAAGVNVCDLTLSTSSIYEARREVRRNVGAEIYKNLCPTTPLVVHFDRKLLPDIDGWKSDRLPFVVSGHGVEKLLGIPKLPSGIGVNMANFVVEFLQEWPGVADQTVGLCFDTTDSNTGVHAGAITIIQRFFDRRLYFFECRHHLLLLFSTNSLLPLAHKSEFSADSRNSQ